MRVLQFLTVRTPGATARLARLGAHPAVSTVFDLEDGLWDPLDEARTADLKAEGRQHLVALARNHSSQLAQNSLGVRINRITGPEGQRDLEAVSEAARDLHVDHVVASKIERGRDLDAVAAGLRTAGMGGDVIVPIVETRAGVAALGEILEAAQRHGVRWLVYGHFDHALDEGLWPFPGPADAEYWARLGPILAATEAAGIGHVHPPFFALDDPAGFQNLADRLASVCRREFGMITIGKEQTALAAHLAGSPLNGTHDRRWPDSAATPDPEGLAIRIVERYMANRRDGVSFAIDPASGDFISPHLFLAARAYLAKLAHA
jgi:citrate lyase beta subunit